MHSETINIEGMSCNHCVMSVKNALTSQEGVVVESVEIGTAKVQYDPSQIQRGRLVEAIEDIGFDVVGSEDNKNPS